MEHNSHVLTIAHMPGHEPRPAPHIPAVALPELPTYPGDGETDQLVRHALAWDARTAFAAWQAERDRLNESRRTRRATRLASRRGALIFAGLGMLDQLQTAAAGALPELRQSWDAQRQIADRTPPAPPRQAWPGTGGRRHRLVGCDRHRRQHRVGAVGCGALGSIPGARGSSWR